MQLLLITEVINILLFLIINFLHSLCTVLENQT